MDLRRDKKKSPSNDKTKSRGVVAGKARPSQTRFDFVLTSGSSLLGSTLEGPSISVGETDFVNCGERLGDSDA